MALLAGNMRSVPITSNSRCNGGGRWAAEPCSVARIASRGPVRTVKAQAGKSSGSTQEKEAKRNIKSENASPLELGPIGMTIGGESSKVRGARTKGLKKEVLPWYTCLHEGLKHTVVSDRDATKVPLLHVRRSRASQSLQAPLN